MLGFCFFLFWRKEKGNGGGNRKGLHFVCQMWRSGIWGAGLAFGIASRKGKAVFGKGKGRVGI